MEQTRRVAVVTAAGGGIGRATVRRMLEENYAVVAVDKDARKLEQLADEYGNERLSILTGDITRPEQVTRVFDQVAQHGPIHILVNGVGSTCSGGLQDLRLDTWQQMFGLNLTSVFLCVRSALPLLSAAAGDRVIINLSSTLARIADPQTLAYGAFKAALEQMTRSLALDLAPQRIRVVAVAPGPVAETGGEAQWEQATYARLNPLGRFATPDELAEVITFLASPAAGYMTGSIYSIDGGDAALGAGWGPLNALIRTAVDSQ
jgi:NAD(P)-dependent dehydrogenase (short-subunit alcohol dehydrogenase family)